MAMQNDLTNQIVEALGVKIAQLEIQNAVQTAQINQLLAEMEEANKDDETEETKEKGDVK